MSTARKNMSRIFVANPFAGTGYETDFADFVSIVKGTSIVSLADSDGFIEFGLSESLMIRIESDERGTLRVTVISTLNPDEVSPARIQLVAEDEEPSAALVENRLHNLRQFYAITLLLNRERGEELAAALRRNPDVDLEQLLLRDDERLYLQAAGRGTWWVTAVTKIGKAPQAALNTLSLVYGEGREMLLERVRAGTDMKKAEVDLKRAETDLKEAEAEAKRIANDVARRKALIGSFADIEKIKNQADRERVREAFLSSMASANPTITAPTIAKLLPPPDSIEP
jgi:hypothetical protein